MISFIESDGLDILIFKLNNIAIIKDIIVIVKLTQKSRRLLFLYTGTSCINITNAYTKTTATIIF